MTGYLILAASVLILLVLLLVFVVYRLVGVMRGANTGKIGLSNKINAAIIPLFFVVGLVAFYLSYQQAKPYFLPEASSVHGLKTDFMFWFTMAILTFAFLVTNALLFWFPFKYQYKEDRKAYYYPDNHKLELIWTIIPAVVMTGLVYYGLKQWNIITTFPAENECEVIEVMGKQFGWQVRYPGKDNQLGRYKFKAIDLTNEFGIDFTDSASYDDFIPRELHIPKGKKVLLRIRSRDVIHSVFLPHFRVKMDAVPGMPTKFWFIPTKSTQEMRDITGNPSFNYELACTEVCGRGHYAMRYLVVVDEPEDFVAWKASQNPWSLDNADYVSALPGSLVKKSIPVPSVLPVDSLAKDSEVEVIDIASVN